MGGGARHDSTAAGTEDRPSSRGVVRALGGRPAEATSDARLVALVRGGDERAAVELFDRYAPLVRRLLVRWMGPSEEIRDLLQDVLMAVVEGLGDLHDPAALRSFVYGVAVNHARMAVRKKVRHRFVLFGRDARREPSAEAPEQGPRRAVRQLYELLGAMGEEPRALFVLRYVEELPVPEIAEILGLSLTTTKRRLERARALLCARARQMPELEDYLVPECPSPDEEEASHG